MSLNYDVLFDVSNAPLDLILPLAFRSTYPATDSRHRPVWATHWMEQVAQTYPASHHGREYPDRLSLVLFTADPGLDNCWPFPSPLNEQATAVIVWEWLRAAWRGPQPDTDGSVAEGHRIHNERWQTGGSVHGLLIAEPIWVVHGK